MQGGIEGPVEYPERVVGAVLDEAGDRVAVHGPAGERAEDEDVQRPLEKVAWHDTNLPSIVDSINR
jgi:hypothetical protein